jgi:hypothetical protein
MKFCEYSPWILLSTNDLAYRQRKRFVIIGPDGLKFLAKTAQAVVLAVAELAGGIEACDLSNIYGEAEPANDKGPML